MDNETDDIISSFNLSAVDKQEYNIVMEIFENFIKNQNLIYKRAKFNHIKQRDVELVDSFVTSLYMLTEHCCYGTLHNKMIRDHIVVDYWTQHYLRTCSSMQT